MATKKQKRRRAKGQRHDYVWVDDDGNEVEPDEASSEKGTKRESTSRLQRSPVVARRTSSASDADSGSLKRIGPLLAEIAM